MSVLIVPRPEPKPWPSLGPLVCAWMEAHLVRGPGDMLGEPLKLDEEWRWLIRRMYEVYPPGHPRAGRRRFKRVCISLRKGTAKTEVLALVCAAELHSRAPVRCVGFDKKGRPRGLGVRDPYIPMIAYTEEQSDELAYSALRKILARSSVAEDFDIGEERVQRIGGDGVAEALSSAPDARDGARTTFNAFDETHRFVRYSRAKAAHKTMQANTPKRAKADPWSLEITTAPAPGEGSVAEAAYEHALQIEAGKVSDPSFFYFHRAAGLEHDIATPDGLRAAVIEASGPAAAWSDIDTIVAQWSAPDADSAYLERVWLNRLVQATDKAFDPVAWRKLEKPDYAIPKGALVVLGFDGARRRDSTAIVVTEVATGHQVLFGLWERPADAASDWEVPVLEVKARMAAAFGLWDVWRVAADPAYWETVVDEWAGEHGEDRVAKRWTGGGFEIKTAYGVRAYAHAQIAGEMSHDGNADFARHIGNAHKKPISRRDDEGKPLWSIQKERGDSPNKIDVAMAAVLSWEARGQAIAEGVKPQGPSVYEERGLLVF